MLPFLNPKPLNVKDCFGIKLKANLGTAMSLQNIQWSCTDQNST